MMEAKEIDVSRGRELIKNTTIVSVGRVCTKMISFLLLPLYTAVLSQEEYGVADLVFSYVSLISTAFFFQIEDALFRYLIDKRHKDEEKSIVISTSFAFGILQCCVLILIYCIVQHWIPSPYKIYLLWNVITAVAAGMCLQVSRGLGDNVGYALASFITALITILSNILMVLVFSMGVKGLLLSTCVGYLACTAYIFKREHLYHLIRLGSIQVQMLREMLKYSLPLVPNVLSWWVISVSDKTIVSAFLGVASNGIIAVSLKFSTIYTMVYGIFNLTWTESAFLHINAPDREEYFSYIIESAFRFLAGACLGIIAVLPFVYNLLIHEQFAQAYWLIPLYMLSALFFSLIGFTV